MKLNYQDKAFLLLTKNTNVYLETCIIFYANASEFVQVLISVQLVVLFNLSKLDAIYSYIQGYVFDIK